MSEEVKRIAREVADRLATTEYSWHDCYRTVVVGVAGCDQAEAGARKDTEQARQDLAGEIERAIERALLACPVPSPVSEERLAGIFRLNADADGRHHGVAARMHSLSGRHPDEWINTLVKELLTQIAFLTRLLQDLSADGAVAQYRAGWEACEEQHRKQNTAEPGWLDRLD